MITGVGIDVVEIGRVSGKLAKRILTDREYREYEARNHSREYLAGRFALKEAFFKAVGTGLKGNSFEDIEFLRGNSGEPKLRILKDFDVPFKFAHVSLSHDLVAVAIVVLEWKKGGIIVKGEPREFEVLRSLGEDLYEIESDLGPHRLRDVLRSSGVELLEYGNIWRDED